MLFQFLVNGIISGALIGIVAIGFWFIYRSTNLFHIAHGSVYTASAYIFYSLYAALGVTLYVSLPLALLAGAILGIGMYFIVYEPLERNNASDGVKFISSLAAYILIVNVIAINTIAGRLFYSCLSCFSDYCFYYFVQLD
jgi:branched-chain amino acid transport system permease protein